MVQLGGRTSKHKWTGFIAKVGHKAYPNESITEHLISRLGECSGFRMAKTKLMRANTQLRFLSQDFLQKDESLVHGAQIFASYLLDEKMVKDIEDSRLESDLFTFQFICRAIQEVLPNHYETITQDFVKMLCFDTLVGNNDRHHWNWGVIVDARGRKAPRFSPIYDSARGLFWNELEEKIEGLSTNPPLRKQFIQNYTLKSAPMTGWDGISKLNHFGLIKNIYQNHPELKPLIREAIVKDTLTKFEEVLHNEFRDLLSENRRNLILDYLKFRLEAYNNATKEDKDVEKH